MKRSQEYISRKMHMLNQLKNPFVALPVVLFVVAAAFAAYSYTQLAELRQDPIRVAQQEAEDLVKRVGKLIVLPEGEQPTIATVSDAESLKEQPFFSNSKIGDKVLIYTGARRVILYDPVNNRIVEVAPLSIGETVLEGSEESGENEEPLEAVPALPIQ